MLVRRIRQHGQIQADVDQAVDAVELGEQSTVAHDGECDLPELVIR